MGTRELVENNSELFKADENQGENASPRFKVYTDFDLFGLGEVQDQSDP